MAVNRFVFLADLSTLTAENALGIVAANRRIQRVNRNATTHLRWQVTASFILAGNPTFAAGRLSIQQTVQRAIATGHPGYQPNSAQPGHFNKRPPRNIGLICQFVIMIIRIVICHYLSCSKIAPIGIQNASIDNLLSI
jgi:hypothetical protein